MCVIKGGLWLVIKVTVREEREEIERVRWVMVGGWPVVHGWFMGSGDEERVGEEGKRGLGRGGDHRKTMVELVEVRCGEWW